MATIDGTQTTGSGPIADQFQELLASCLSRFDREGTGALDAFRAEHPAFSSRLGKQLDWLVQQLAEPEPGLPATIGPYRILRRIGKGGMGVVHLAEQTAPFHRIVAVKMVQLGQDADLRVQRFASEIQAIASLNHNGIAKVFEAGREGDLPWFSMEYVPGRPITAYCAEERLGLVERLRLLVEVCRGVEHAHRQGIVHLDLKPSNILVYGPRTEPIAKIIDFGLAKAIEPDRARQPDATHSGRMVGTPDYMSPEQVDDSGRTVVDTRTDVYALGVVLYELLTGMLPLSVGLIALRDVEAMVRIIRERQPVPPSMRVAEGPSVSGTSPSDCGLVTVPRLRRLLAGDLDSIVQKALAKDVDRRYGGAAQLADDVLRHLRDEPVSARRHTRAYLMQKFVRRHRVAVAFWTSLLVLVLAGLVTVNVYALENQRNLERGNLFGLVHYFGELQDRDSVDPPVARPERVEELREWLREFESLLAQRDRMRAFIASAAEDAGAVNPADWASGKNVGRALRSSLVETLRDLEKKAAPGAELDNMRLRIDWAQRVVGLTVTAHRESWERVRREVLDDPRFAELDLQPQVGLIPLERDADTGLQLFALPLPGCDLPQRVDGRWPMRPRTCPVFVLLPGGADVMIGSHGNPADRFRFDPNREPMEADLQRVRIEPFFASMYELTNGQWQLVDGGEHTGDPTNRLTEISALEHPFGDANDAWIQHNVHAWGMQIPTSFEWEYLARGGTDTPYWCGPTFESLQDNENLFDQSREVEPDEVVEGGCVPWSDRFPRTAPVGSLKPNGFLLYDVLGNVCEIAFRDDPAGAYFELRGSSYHEGARDARATARMRWDGGPKPSVGFRPIIPVQR